MEVLWWLLAVILMLAGLAGTVVPVLPGPVFILAGAVIGAWVGNFTLVSGGTVVILAVLAIVAWVLDFVAGLLGAKGAGASRQALLGATLGTVAGLFFGLVGVLLLPFVGAVAGEWIARGSGERALKVGAATWVGVILGMAAKVVIGFTMIGVFIVALLV